MGAWDVLRVAVAEEWGGRGAATRAASLIDDLLWNMREQWAAGHDLHTDSLDEFIEEVLAADFACDFEDDTPITQVSLLLQTLYRAAAAGDDDAVRAAVARLPDHEISQRRAVDRPAQRLAADSDDDGSDEDGSDEEEGGNGGGASAGDGAGVGAGAGAGRQIDADGWETVARKK